MSFGARKGSECEMCGELAVHSKEFTVCSRCDRAAEEADKLVMKAATDAWASKRKCRECGKGLSLSRYFQCEECLRPDELPSDDATLESMDDWNMDARVMPNMRPTRVPASGLKSCIDCGAQKDRTEFKVNNDIRYLDTHHNHCKPCGVVRSRNALQRRRARKAGFHVV